MAAVRHVGEHGIVGARVDRTHQHLIVALLGAVIGCGQQQALGDRALGIDRDARVIAKVAVEAALAAHLAGDALLADRAFGQADNGPRLLAGFDPGIEFLAAALFTVGQVKFGVELAARHGRGQFDIGDPVVALDVPARGRTAEPGQRAGLHRVERFGAFIGSGKAEFTGQPGVNRTAVAIGDAQRQDRTGGPVGHQPALVAQQLDPRRGGGIVHVALQLGDGFTLAVADGGRKPGQFARKRNAAPDRDGVAAARRLAGAFEGHRRNRLAIGAELDLLVGAVADHHPDRRRAGIVVDRREQEVHRAIALGQPIDIGPGGSALRGFGSGIGGGCALARRCSGIFHFFIDSYNRTFRQSRGKVGDNQAAALPDHEARAGAARAAGRTGAIGELAALGQGVGQRLDHVGSGHQPFEMIAAIGVGNGEAAVLQHHPDPGDAIVDAIDRAATVGDPPDQGDPRGQVFAQDPYRGAGLAGAAQAVAGDRTVFRGSGGGIGPHGHGIGDLVARTGGHITQAEREAAAIRRELKRARGGGLAIDPDRVLAQPQQRRRPVDQGHAGLDVQAVGIGQGDAVEHHVAGQRGRPRGSLGDRHADRRMIDRNIDPYRRRAGQGKALAERGDSDGHRQAIGANQPGKLRRGLGRRRGERGRRQHDNPVLAQRNQREAVLARQHRMDIARPVCHRLAGIDHRRPRGDAIVGIDPGWSAGQGIDQHDPHAANRRAVLAVEHQAIGICQHIHLRGGDRRAVAGIAGGNGDFGSGTDRQAAIAMAGSGGDCRGLDRADEDPAIGGGFKHGQHFAVAGSSGDRRGQAVDRGGIGIGGRRADPEVQRIANPQCRGRINRNGKARAAGARKGNGRAAAGRGRKIERLTAGGGDEGLDRDRALVEAERNGVRIDREGIALLGPAGRGGIADRLGLGGRHGQKQRCKQHCHHAHDLPENAHRPLVLLRLRTARRLAPPSVPGQLIVARKRSALVSVAAMLLSVPLTVVVPPS